MNSKNEKVKIKTSEDIYQDIVDSYHSKMFQINTDKLKDLKLPKNDEESRYIPLGGNKVFRSENARMVQKLGEFSQDDKNNKEEEEKNKSESDEEEDDLEMNDVRINCV